MSKYKTALVGGRSPTKKCRQEGEMLMDPRQSKNCWTNDGIRLSIAFLSIMPKASKGMCQYWPTRMHVPYFFLRLGEGGGAFNCGFFLGGAASLM